MKAHLAALILVLMLVLMTMAMRELIVPMTPMPTATIVVPHNNPSSSLTPPSPTPTPMPTPTPTPTIPPSPSTGNEFIAPTLAPPSPPKLPHPTPVYDLPVTNTLPVSLPVPTPMPTLPLPKGVINVLLLGMDRESHNGGRTDVMVVVSVNPEGPSVSMLSIPRDYYAWIPGYGFGKINTAINQGKDYPGGRIALVKAVVEYNFGIPIHYYALVDFQGFIRIVNALGGVDVPIECEFHDTFPDPANPEQGIDIDLYPGIQHLDGQHALWYVRSRWSTSDFDRNRRQQQVLRALYRQALNGGVLGRIPELWDALQQTVETDLGLKEMLYLGWIGAHLDWANVKSRFIGPPYVERRTDLDSAYVLLPVPGALETLIAEALQPPATRRARQSPFRVEIRDGTGRPGMAEVAAERLRWEGFVVTGITATEPVSRTRVVDFTTTAKGSPLWLLTRLYDLKNEDIQKQPQEGSPVDFRVILGANYNSCIRPGAIRYVPAPTPTPGAGTRNEKHPLDSLANGLSARRRAIA